MSRSALRALFITSLSLLCLSSGFTAQGGGESAFLVKDIRPGPYSGAPDEMIALNNNLLFRAWSVTDHDSMLWRSDGTASGTGVLKDISPMGFHRFGNLVVFGEGLPWRCDGTVEGTYPLATNNAGGPEFFTEAGGILFFGANSYGGRELWRTDGTTTASTYMVRDINPGQADSYASPLADVNGVLFLVADDGVHGVEFWKSDGTASGTVLVRDIIPGATGSICTGSWWPYSEFQGRFFFAATDGAHGYELWKSDGTASGTMMVKDMNPGSADAFISQTGQFRKAGGKLFFTAYDGVHGIELWVTDGTEQGTHMAKDINPGPDSSLPFTLVALGDSVYTAAYSPDYGRELWRSDGTEAGTKMVKDIYPGPTGGWPIAAAHAVAGGRLYFDADDGVYGRELWTTDGTPEATYRLTDINPSSAGSYPVYFAATDDLLFFSADDGVHGEELWAIPLLPAPRVPTSAQPAWWRRY